MKLSTKLTLLFLLLALVPLLLVGYLAYESSRRAIEQNTVSRLVANTVFKKDEFNRWLASSGVQLRQFARRPQIREFAMVLTSPTATEAQTQAVHDRILYDHFNPTLHEEVGFLVFFLLDSRTGQILVSTDPNHEGMYREHETYFIEGKKGTYVDNVRYLLSLGQAVLHIATPVKDESGQVVAVIAGRLDLAIMTEIMHQESGLNPSEETYLVNNFNFFVTNPKLGQDDLALKKAVYTPGVQNCLAGRTGFGLYNNYRAMPVMGAYRWLPEQELCILTEVDQAEAFAPIYRLRNVIMGVGGLVAAGVALLGILFARSITQPILQLVAGTEAVGQGNLDYRIKMTSQDEIGELANTFNQMAARRQQNEQVLQEQQEELRQARDELELRVAERTTALQQSEERFRLLVNSMDDIIFTLDREGRHSGVFGQWVEQAGLTPEFFLGKTARQILGPEAASVHEAANARALAGDHVIYEWTAFGADGPQCYQTSLSPIWVSEELTGIVGVGRNITILKRAEEGLRESEARLRRAIVDAPFPIMLHAEDGEVILISETWASQTGYSQADIPTTAAWTEKAYGQKMELVQKDIDRLYGLEGRVDEGEYEITTRNGQKITWAFSSAPLGRLPDGRRLVISMAMDVTERKQAETALAQQAEELARSNKELEQFAYVASHDLQEPLRMVASYLQLLERRYGDKLDDNAREFIAYAVDGASRMKTLINDLLAYSRLGTRGKEFEPTNCERVLERVLTNLQLAIEDGQATITYDPLPTVLGDTGQIEQLLQNLIGNALKFHGDAPPQIHVGAERQGGKWRIWVRDNGIGIEPEFAERVFIIFQRLHGKEEYPGTGIGLAICKKIVERHGGRLWVESKLGQGATFYFTLLAAEERIFASQ